MWPRRWEIVGLLARRGAVAGGALGVAVGLPERAPRKPLGVVRKGGVVPVTKQGRERLYNPEAAQLKPVHDWVKTFEHLWSQQLHRIKGRAERKARNQPDPSMPPDSRKGAS